MSTLELKRVSVDLIDANPDNARRSVGDLSELAESIREVGIIQPPICRNGRGENGDRYELIAGHRRTAAAIRAGLTEIDILIRSGDDKSSRQVAQLVENLQRRDLDAVEEATGYMRAVGLGMTQKALARAVGRSQGHVANRLRLLELPAKVLVDVKKGTLPPADALHLLELDDKQTQIEMAQNAVSSSSTFALERKVAERVAWAKAEAQKAARVSVLVGQKVAVLDEQPGYEAKHIRRLGQEMFFEEGPKANKLHAKEPCHAVFVGVQWGRLVEMAYCTDTKRHLKSGKSELKTKAGGTVDPVERAERAHKKDVQKASKDFLGSYLRKLPTNAEMIDALASNVIAREVRQYTERGLCEVFGIEPALRSEKQGDKVVTRRDHGTPLRQFMADPKNRLRVAFAVTFMGVQNDVSDVASLVELGFTPPESPVRGPQTVAQGDDPMEGPDTDLLDEGDDGRYDGDIVDDDPSPYDGTYSEE